MPVVSSSTICVMCRHGIPRIRVQILKTGRTVEVCSVKCLLAWCLGFSIDGVQGVVRKLLQGVPK